MEIFVPYYQAMLKRAEEIIEFAKEKGWTEEELRRAVELIETMID